MMILSAGDLGVEIDFGDNETGATQQREEKDGWRDYLIDGEPVVNPVDIETLPSGRYRVRD